MRIWSWTVDEWNAAFQGFAILCIAGTLLAGAGKFWTDKKIRDRRAEESAAEKARTAKVEANLAKQQERADKTEKDFQERFKRRTMSPRERNDLLGLLRAYSSLAREAREKNRETLWIVHPSGDTESTEFCFHADGPLC